ncbi:hypothetical protein CBM2598_U10198 [Cupriavidus taiwanensis]|nr:hypothetical protein CBM2598_U10198 [Cupriavidus taiwanensis]
MFGDVMKDRLMRPPALSSGIVGKGVRQDLPMPGYQRFSTGRAETAARFAVGDVVDVAKPAASIKRPHEHVAAMQEEFGRVCQIVLQCRGSGRFGFHAAEAFVSAKILLACGHV